MKRLLLPCTALIMLSIYLIPCRAEILSNPLIGNNSYLSPLSVAEDQGLSAIFTNPALLALHPGEWGVLHYRGITDRGGAPGSSLFTSNWGGVVGGQVALAIDHGHTLAGYDYHAAGEVGVSRPFNRYSLAVSEILDLHPLDSQLAFGAAARYCRSEAYTLDGYATYDLGALYRWKRWLSLGAVAHDINSPTLKGLEHGDNKLVATSYDLALAIRPGSDWLTLSVQSNQQKLDGIWTYRTLFGVKVQPWRQFSVRMSLDDKQRISTSLQLSWHNWRSGVNLDNQRSSARGSNYGSYTLEYRNRRFSRSIRRNTRLLHFELDGVIPEYATGDADGGSLSVHRIIDLTRKVAKEPDVAGILFTLHRPLLGLSHIEEIRRELISFHQTTGKPVIFYSEDYLLEDYFLASAGSQVLINPLGVIWMDGLTLIRPDLNRTLTRHGLKPQLLHRAINSGTLQMLQPTGDGSEAARIDSTVLANRLAVVARGIAESRKLDLSSFTRYFNIGPYDADLARDYHLVDRRVHRNQLPEYLDEEIGSHKLLPAEEFGRRTDSKGHWGPDKYIAIIHLEGMITRNSSGDGLFGGQCSTAELVAQIEQVRTSSRYIGAVIRIDSGGGELLAADELRRALATLSSTKPVVVSMGNIATGCAYTTALPAQQILANRSSITGGLGVIGGKIIKVDPHDESGISYREVATMATPELNPWREYEPRDLSKLQRRIDDHYQRLVEDIATRFYISESEVNLLSRGRIMTSAEAMRFGMIDKIGGLRDAKMAVKRLAGTALGREVITEDLPAVDEGWGLNWNRLLFWRDQQQSDPTTSVDTISFWDGSLHYLPPPFDGEMMLSFEAFEMGRIPAPPLTAATAAEGDPAQRPTEGSAVDGVDPR